MGGVRSRDHTRKERKRGEKDMRGYHEEGEEKRESRGRKSGRDREGKLGRG